jgi:hypothetical protein
MSIEAALTVAAVVLAVLTLIPAERGNDIRLRLGGLPTIAFYAALVLLLYWTFLEQVHALPGLRNMPRPLRWLWHSDPSSVSLLTLLVAGGLGWFCYRRRLSVYRVPKLYEAITDALARRRFVECVHLLETHFVTLRQALEGDYWLQRLRVRRWPSLSELHLAAVQSRAAAPAPGTDADKQPPGTPTESIPETDSAAAVDRLAALAEWSLPEPNRTLRPLIAAANRPLEAAEDLLRTLSQTPAFTRELATTNPYLGVRLLPLRSSWVADAFAETFARALLADPESIFYREMRRAQNIDLHNVPLVDTREQPLLSLLCEDACSADGATLLWCFLNAGMEALRGRSVGSRTENFNGPLDDYFERERWTSAPFAALYLLEIVVPRVAVAPHAQVINLFVVDSFVRVLLEKLAPAPDSDPTAEWPTPIHYLLYQCVSLLVDTVNISRQRPQEFERVQEAQHDHPQAVTVPRHAADVLGSVIYACLRSPKLTARFKGYLLSVWWRAYWEKYRKDPWPLTDAVLDGLVCGGALGTGDMAHRDGLKEALVHIDIMLRCSDPANALRSRFGIDPE